MTCWSELNASMLSPKELLIETLFIDVVKIFDAASGNKDSQKIKQPKKWLSTLMSCTTQAHSPGSKIKKKLHSPSRLHLSSKGDISFIGVEPNLTSQ